MIYARLSSGLLLFNNLWFNNHFSLLRHGLR
ncbi:hypothetical protein WL1483_2439 [Aeromonas schubertii]|uniref:Uncharacterized protein n=1 Tax=Aeromonas schubertii TaxID=652 RepID=A0A0S2SJM3_9GAMM|nr:hypothetical protein WL1483_2439 [Aeromonas schubertii]